MPNATHRKRLARAYASQAGITYMAALDAVTKAATDGRLPSRLDDAGMAAALRILATGDSATPTVIAAALSAATLTGSTPKKVASDPRDQQIYDLSAVYEYLTGKQGLVYISSPGSGKDKYVFGGVGGGHVCRGREEALAHITGLLNDVHTHLDPTDRNPYVGEGSDGARRSAQIDREEADGLDANDPRREELLLSAHRWDMQAARLEANPLHAGEDDNRSATPVATAGECQHANTDYRGGDGTYCVDCGELLATFDQLKAADRFHLEPAALRLLRQVWQGRVALEAVRGTNTRYSIDNVRASIGNDIELRWLAANDYITAPLLVGEEWAVARTTEFGEDVLAVNGANTDKFHDGLPVEKKSPSRKTKTIRDLDPTTDRRFGGPTSTTVYDDRNRRVNATCDVCNRRLKDGEEWWIVRSEGRAWVDDLGVACSDHHPVDLPIETTAETENRHSATQPTANMTTATVRSLLKVRDTFVNAGRVEWWWHVGPFAGSHGFKTVVSVDDEDGSLILRDEDPTWMEPTTRLSLDYIDDADKAARHLVRSDHTSVTFCQPDGTADATYTVAPPVTASVVSPAGKVHKARPNPDETHCVVCHQRVKKVPGGNGPTWVHTESGAVAAPGADTTADPSPRTGTVWHVARDGGSQPRCTATSWRGGGGQRAGESYGPGGYNRCVKALGHHPADGGEDVHHLDEWGNLFVLTPTKNGKTAFRVARVLSNEEMAEIAREHGQFVGTGFEPEFGRPVTAKRRGQTRPTQVPHQNTLWWAGTGKSRVMVKVSEHYPEDNKVTAEVVYPVPPRTTVRSFTVSEAMDWVEPSDADVRRYERAWGLV